MARIPNQETTFSLEILAGWGIEPESLNHPIKTEVVEQAVARILSPENRNRAMVDLQLLQDYIERIKAQYDNVGHSAFFDHYTNLWLIVFDAIETFEASLETSNIPR